MNEKIKEMYAFVDPTFGHDVILMARLSDRDLLRQPLIATDWAEVIRLAPYAQAVANETGNRFRVIKFERVADVTELL